MQIIKKITYGLEIQNDAFTKGEIYLAELMGEVEQAQEVIDDFIKLVNEFNVKATRLIREDLNGHPLYIQDIVEIDDISIKIAAQVKMAKNWLKQLTSEADNDDLDGSDLMFKSFERRVREVHFLTLKSVFEEQNNQFIKMKDDFYKVEDRVLDQHRIRVKRKHEEMEEYGLVPNYEQLKKRHQWDQVDSETAIDTFLRDRKIEYSATDDVDTAMKDLLALFKQLDNYIDSHEGQLNRISDYFNAIEDQVVTGAEHLELAFANKKAADRRRAILWILAISTVASVLFFGGGFLLVYFI